MICLFLLYVRGYMVSIKDFFYLNILTIRKLINYT